MRRADAWLAGLATATVAAAAVLLSGTTAAVPRVAAGFALTLLLPGCALSTAVFPPGGAAPVPRQLSSWLTRGIWSAGLGLAAAVLGGLVLDAAPGGLTRLNWTLFLGAVTLLALAVTWLRTSRGRTSAAAAALNLSPASWWQAIRRRWPPRGRTLAIGGCVAGAVLLGSAALAIARVSAERHNPSDFAQLWLVRGKAPAATVGVRSYYPGDRRYHLVFRRGAQVVLRLDLTLAMDQAWQRTVTGAAGQRLSAELTTAGRGGPPQLVWLTVPKGTR